MRFSESDFERVVGALDTDAAPNPEHREKLRKEMLVAFGQAEQARKRSSGPREPWAIFRLDRRGWRVLGKWAAAAAIVLVIAGAVWLMAGGKPAVASDSFAAVLQRVQTASTVTYDISLEGAGPGFRSHVVVAEPGLLRHETSGGKTWVMDFARERGLLFSPDRRTAFLVTGTEMIPRSELDLLAHIRKLGRQDGRLIAKTTLNGKAANVFEVDGPIQKVTIWANPATDLPMRVQIVSHASSTGARAANRPVVLSGFAWNTTVSRDLFSLDPPPGYILRDLHAEEVTETDLVDSLRLCTVLSSGVFPSEFDKRSVVRLIRQSMRDGTSLVNEKRLAVSDLAVVWTGELSQDLKTAHHVLTRGLEFVQRQVRAGHEWHYRGAGIKLGDGRSIVCWWKPQGLSGYRAVFGDLTVRATDGPDLPSPDTLPSSSPWEDDPTRK